MPATLARPRRAPTRRSTGKAGGDATSVRRDLYQEVTDRVVGMLEQGVAPWRKPWKVSGNGVGLPRNIATGKPYRGVNPFLLGMTALERGYSSPWWGTYRQVAERGGQVRKGEHGTLIVFWKQYRKQDPDADNGERSVFVLRAYSVFNAQQCDGLDEFQPHEQPPEPSEPAEIIGRFDAAVADYVASLGSYGEGGDAAYYRATADHVQVPRASDHDCPEEYCSTKAHELTHSTGHRSRLGRDVGECRFGSHRYGKEELVAEMGSAMFAGLLGFDVTLPNSAGYIQGWIDQIKGSPRMVVQAAAQAQKAVDLILGVTFDDESEE